MQTHSESQTHDHKPTHEDQSRAAEHEGHNHSGPEPHEVTHEDHQSGSGMAHQRGDHANQHGDHAGHVDHSGHEQMFRQRFWVNLLLTVPVLVFSPMIQRWLGFSTPEFPGSRWIGPIFALVIFFYGGTPFITMAVPEVRRKRPGMMTLISLAISVAFVYSVFAAFTDPETSFFWEMATLIDIMLLGHWIEMRSIRQASGALHELAKLMPDTAELIGEDGEVQSIAASQLKQGDLVLVRPGGSVPSDGEIVQGTSGVNQAMITGESKPVTKHPGDKVIGGTINGEGSLRVRVTATGSDTALAGIMRLVEQAQQSKSDTQILADRAAGWLFYIALGAAALTAVAWSLAEGFNSAVLARVVTVLVIACPHALGLAVPLVVAISTSLGARNGILVRDRLALEEARKLDIVIFDKTGTLTKGEFGVVDMAVSPGWNTDQALALTAAVEGDSEHLLAQAIRREAVERNLERLEVHHFEAIKGRGIHAEFDGRTVYVGGPRLLELLEVRAPETLQRFTAEAGRKAQTVVYLVDGEEVVAAFALADVIRAESREAVKQLQARGVEVAMLTGDSEDVARAVADELGIATYFAEVLPENKDQKVSQLQQQGKRVAMVGDGINDAPALTRADVGIAIGSGTDVAIESAGIILIESNPMDIVRIFDLSSATYKKMMQNLFWAAGYNIVALPLAAGALAPLGILLSPAVGAALMSLSTVVVAINAQLLRRLDLGRQTGV
ncbi:MAG: copper-translocating P-type ATPase [Anaerolineae bacterium]|nr:copper-translocating P-type ATPase [Anaerolineae bacterium]